MPDSTLKPELLQKYAGGRKVFVETGTARGEGLQVALEHGFTQLYSIEANPDVYEAACRRFIGNSNVELLFGDAGKVLPTVLSTLREPAVFWLDSHWSKGEAPLSGDFSPCPVLAELRAIAEHPIRNHVILIDDIRYFWRGIPQWNGITVSDILQMVLEVNPNYWLRIEAGVTPADILVAVPGPFEAPVHEAVEAYEGLR